MINDVSGAGLKEIRSNTKNAWNCYPNFGLEWLDDLLMLDSCSSGEYLRLQ